MAHQEKSIRCVFAEDNGMQVLFAATLFASAFLLFLVQPLVGRMLLPLWGGSPAVWNTCMVFFQTALLAGYSYSHLVGSRLSMRWQVILHLPVLALPAIVLPLEVSEEVARAAAETSYPEFQLLKVLIVAVGLPFFVVATTGPCCNAGLHKRAITPPATRISCTRPVT